MTAGSLCISIDVERAWGVWDKPSREYFQRCEVLERQVTSELLELFDRYEVSATWALVGRLLEEDTTRPGAMTLWYGPETLELIAAARTPQEIGSHSYEHVYFGQISRGTADADLESAARVHETHGLDFKSFVFPRNDVAHLDVLVKHGIKVYRSVDQGMHIAVRKRLGRLAGRAANLLDKVLPIPPVAVEPIVHENGLVELPSSMLLMSRKGARRAIHPRAAVLKACLGLERAASAGRVFHLWFHPSNFYYRTEQQLEVLGQILARARDLRERGRLEIRTMGSFAVA